MVLVNLESMLSFMVLVNLEFMLELKQSNPVHKIDGIEVYFSIDVSWNELH